MYEELIKTILEAFNSQRMGDSLLKSLEDKLRINVAGYREAQIYAEKNANILNQLLREIIDGSYLVDGTIPYDLSSELLPEALKDLHKGVAEYSRDIQTAINKKAGVNIKGQLLEFNDEQIDRVTRFAKKISECKSESTFRSFLEAGIDNYSRSIVDDTAKYNAKFNYDSGVAGKIVRTTTNNSCKWCREVAGEYKYPGTPKDVFRRHQRCTCIVEYFPDKHRYRQDVWSKKKFKLLEREANRNERVERLKNFNLRSFRLVGSPLNRTLTKTIMKG